MPALLDRYSTLFVRYDRIRIINLPERRDRRHALSRHLQARGFNPSDGTFFAARRPKDAGPFITPGAHGAFLSHAEILSEAARASESVLILEDDCQLLPGAEQYEIPDCDIFYGSHAEDSDVMIGAHCMGFSARAVKLVDAYLTRLTKPDFEVDAKAASEPTYDPNLRPPIDGAYVWFRRAHPELTTHFALLAQQRSSRSDVTPGKFDKYPVVSAAIEPLRRIKNAFPWSP